LRTFDSRLRIVAACLVVALLALYLAGQTRNPPGFDFDESSVAYNALTIAQSGVDEHGISFPLYFRAFGEYKNPTYIYLLSGVFRVLSPGPLTARRLSAILGWAAAIALGWLGWRVTRRGEVALLTLLFAALTPLFFEISRLAFEVALFPLAVAVFLLAARGAYEQPRWRAGVVLSLVATLSVVSYTYTAGRLLGPIFAVMLAFFLTRRRAAALMAVWLLYAVTLAPMFVVNARTDGALLKRPGVVVEGQTAKERVAAFARNYVANLDPLRFALRGDPNVIHHIPGSGGSILLMTPLLAVIGVASRGRERWTWFLVAGALAAIAPAAITVNIHHSLRLSGYPVFLSALSIPAFEVLVRRDAARALRAGVAIAVLAGALQACFFFVVFHRDRGTTRHYEFHYGAKQVIDHALAQPQRPIYMTPGQGYVHAYWFAAVRGAGPETFSAIAPGAAAPRGSIVLAGTAPPKDGIPISRHGRFGAYFVP
jgi:hypothetical protein